MTDDMNGAVKEEARVLSDSDRDELLSRLDWRASEFRVEPLRGPLKEHPTEPWIIRVSLGDRSVILRQPNRGHILLDTGKRGPGARPSTSTSDPNVAISVAEEWLSREVLDALFDARLQATIDLKKQDLTVAEVCTLVSRTDLPSVRSWPRYERACRIAAATLGFVEVRKLDEDMILEAIEKRMSGLSAIGLESVDAVTAVNNFKDFSTVLNRVGKLKAGDDTRLFSNPIRDMKWPKEVTITTGVRPRKKKVVKEKRDPFTLDQLLMLLSPFEFTDTDGRAVKLPAPVDVVDPTGALRLIIMIAMFTGRRFEAILQLRIENIALDVGRIHEVLERADEEARRDWAQYFVHGAIDFSGEWDKESYHWPVPICSLLRQALDHYLDFRGLRSGPLFPAERNPEKPLAQSTVSRNPWTDPKTGKVKIGRFDRAWRLAREYLKRAGRNPDQLMPIRKGYKLHRIRAFFATQMEKLGFGKANYGAMDGHTFDDHVNYIGGWAMSAKIKNDRYIPRDPEVLMGVVEWKKADEVFRRRADLERERAARAMSQMAASVGSGLGIRKGAGAV